jgi:single-strand DNA-binding protein
MLYQPKTTYIEGNVMIIIQIAGRLGRDAETRFTPSGQKVTTLTVATNVRKGGKDETVWWRVTIWGDRFDKIMPYLKKGSAVIVVGEMGKPEIWTDKEGRPQISLEITAEIVRFSPFGNPDRAAQEQQQGSSFNQGFAQGQGAVGQQRGFSHSNSEEDLAAFSAQTQYVSSTAQKTYNQNPQDEEQIPF